MAKAKKTDKKGKPPRAKAASNMRQKYPDISQRLVYVKKKLGLTYDQMAADLKVSGAILRAYALNRATPNYYVLRKLKSLYGIPYEYMIDGTHEPDLESRKSLSRRLDELNRIIREMKKNPGKPGTGK